MFDTWQEAASVAAACAALVGPHGCIVCGRGPHRCKATWGPHGCSHAVEAMVPEGIQTLCDGVQLRTLRSANFAAGRR
eukprot:5686024-Alexandrium_andersonii.AAC.1